MTEWAPEKLADDSSRAGERSGHIEAYPGVVTRTNIDIDDELVSIVMRRYRLGSKSSAVEFALRQLVMRSMAREGVLAMRGTGVEFTNDEVEGDWA